jgi:hypothetical protein
VVGRLLVGVWERFRFEVRAELFFSGSYSYPRMPFDFGNAM